MFQYDEPMASVFAVIMAGGSGTRFWPASRHKKPKQLLALGKSDKPLLAETAERLLPMVPASNILVVTAAHLAEESTRALPNGASVLAEPAPRNTAPCVGWATWELLKKDPEALVMVLPSDHVIDDPDAFRKTLAIALESAAAGVITTIGITPTRPETGYGYIERGAEASGGAFPALRFVEKPDQKTAEQYIAKGTFLWNAGMFFFRAKDMQAAIRTHLPALATLLDPMHSGNVGEVFPSCPSVSIDTGVMEKLAQLRVVPGDFGWSDVGSWEAAWELGARDTQENVVPAGAIMVDAHRNLVKQLGTTQGKLVALVGVEDLVVVDTDDALLVMPRARAQDVRLIVETLKKRGQTGQL
jgi:mannose-1-phosphate guanylyltransferase